MYQYQIEHMDHNFNVLQTFKPEALHFTMNDEDVSTIEYQISKTALDLDGDPVITGNDFISPQNTHWRLSYGGVVTIMAGVHTRVEMEYGQHYMSVAGSDWLWYFLKRFIPFDGRSAVEERHIFDYVIGDSPDGLAYQALNVDLATALTDILDAVLARTYSLPITYSLADTGVVMPHFRLELGATTTLLEIVKTICGYSPGVAFEITPGRVFQVSESPRWYGLPEDLTAKTNPDLVWAIDDDHRPVALSFANSGPRETHLQAEGSGTTTRTVVSLGNLTNQAVYWRTDRADQVENAIIRDDVETRAHEQLEFDLNPVHEIPLTLDPDIVDKQRTHTELITNTGFEVNTNNWAVVGAGTTIASSSDYAFVGTKSCKVQVTAIDRGLEYASSGLTPLTWYRFTVYVFVPNPNVVKFQTSCTGLGAVSSNVRTAKGDYTSEHWHKVVIEFRTGAGQTTTNLRVLSKSTGAHTFYIDAASLIEIGENDGFFWTNFKPGRALWIDLEMIAHHIDSPHHIVSMDCTVADNGVTKVNLALNQIYDVTSQAHVAEG